MNLIVLLAVAAALFGLRFLKPNGLMWIAATWVGIFVFFRFGVEPPLPSSIITMFMGIVTIALLTYLSAGTERLNEAGASIKAFFVEKRFTIPLIATLIVVPLLVAFKVYADQAASPQAPVSSRTIHPPPPATISLNGKQIDLVTAHNPYRDMTDAAAQAAHVENGRRVYYQHCVFCHGDNMEGDGHMAHGFDPIPANFQDPTTIAMLQESYLFWRVAKGGPGLPPESTPWASAMPAWEQFLDEEEIWDVILFLYDYTDQLPRAQETHE